MLAFIAGTGYTGSRVLDVLAADGSVGIDSTTMNLDARAPLPVDLPSRYSVLYTVPPEGEDNTRLRHFLSELQPAPARFVYISTTGVYGNCHGALVTEDSPVKPDSRMSYPRAAAEALLHDWAERDDCELVVLRVPGIYGPGRLGTERLKDGGAFLREADANPGNRIHVDDLVSCCIAALDQGTPAGIYNVGDGDQRSATWFAQEVARQAALPKPRLISREQAEKEFSPVRLAFMSSSRIVDTSRMREVLGVTPRYANPVDGIAASLQGLGL